MNVNDCGYKSGAKQKGFTLFELVVVITIISILATVALDRYSRLLVDVERATMEYNLGVMRSAIAMQVVSRFVAGNMTAIETLADSNPMDLLAETPKNYSGIHPESQMEKIESGQWFYDADNSLLIYKVQNEQYFETGLAKPARARFRIEQVYSDEGQGRTLSGLRLQPVEHYSWLKTRS